MNLLKKHELSKIKSSSVIQLTNNPEFIVDYLMMKADIKESTEQPKETPEKLEQYLSNLGEVFENMNKCQENLMDVYLDLEHQNQTLKNSDNVDKEIARTLDELEEYKRKYQDLEIIIKESKK